MIFRHSNQKHKTVFVHLCKNPLGEFPVLCPIRLVRVWVAFLALVAINITMLLFDIFNPYVGYIRYQRQMAAYTGETASVVLGIIIRKIKGATRI